MKIKSLLAVTILALIARSPLRGTEPPNSSPQLRTATTVPVKYYLALPKNWKAEMEWPVVVTIDGSGHKFDSNIDAFVKARGDRPFIIVTPFVSSNGRDPEDRKAVLAIAKEVQKEFHGGPKFFITGFSAGGHLAWQCVFLHPELLRGAALAGSNFNSRGIDEVPPSEAAEKLPIHGFLGEKDDFLKYLDPQWQRAAEMARENGYKNIGLTRIPGAGHQAFPQQVLDFFDTLLKK